MAEKNTPTAENDVTSPTGTSGSPRFSYGSSRESSPAEKIQNTYGNSQTHPILGQGIFPLMKLPPELRLSVWNLCDSASRVICFRRAVEIRTVTKEDHPQTTEEVENEYLVLTTKAPVILHTDTTTYSKIYFAPERDFLFFVNMWNDNDDESEITVLDRLLPKHVKDEILHLILELHNGTWDDLTEPTLGQDTRAGEIVNALTRFPKTEQVIFSSRAQSIFRSDGSEKLVPANVNMNLGSGLISPQWVMDEMMDSFEKLKLEHPEWRVPTLAVVEMERAAGREWNDLCESLAGSRANSAKAASTPDRPSSQDELFNQQKKRTFTECDSTNTTPDDRHDAEGQPEGQSLLAGKGKGANEADMMAESGEIEEVLGSSGNGV
ncbi:hypothetical protein BKA65DRAFT_560087 [Rhexocercosporidium sp. MPI-PUGE-AT-0058]|nr:hypothetical protein BKA65DRAFT_560087 [Rhexocercosporidium sp. MPI-PUGE-AT-0058]